MVWWIVGGIVAVVYVCLVIFEAKQAPTIDDNKEVAKEKREKRK